MDQRFGKDKDDLNEGNVLITSNPAGEISLDTNGEPENNPNIIFGDRKDDVTSGNK